MPARNAKPIITFAGGLGLSQPGGVIADLQNPVIEIPYLFKANNVLFQDGNSLRKIGGALIASTLTSPTQNFGKILALLPASGGGGAVDIWTVVGGADGDVKGIIGWYLDSRGFIADQYVQLDGDVSGNAAADNYSVWTSVEFEGYTIIMSDDPNIRPSLIQFTPSTSVYSSSVLDTAEPEFHIAAVYKNRLWTAGNPTNPSRLYYSDLFDPTAGYSTNFVDIDPFDGSEITAIHVYKETLFVFKGPNKGSIHRLSGATPSTFALSPISTSIGCAGPNAIADFADDVMFLDTDANLRTLSTTQNFGDFETAVLTDPIRELIDAAVYKSELKYTTISADTENSRVWVQLPTGETILDRLSVVVDYKQGIKLTTVDYIKTAYVVPSRSTVSALGRSRLMAVTPDYLYTMDEVGKERIETFVSGSVTIQSEAYNAQIETPSIKFTPAFGHNNISKVSASVQHIAKQTDTPVGACNPFDPNVDITFRWQRDTSEVETTALSATAMSRLGSVCSGETLPSDGSVFTLDASRLGGAKTMEVYAELETSDFRRITFMFEQGGLNEGLHVHSFSVVIGQDDTGSTENL